MNFYEYFRLLKLIVCNCNDGNSIKKEVFLHNKSTHMFCFLFRSFARQGVKGILMGWFSVLCMALSPMLNEKARLDRQRAPVGEARLIQKAGEKMSRSTVTRTLEAGC